LLRPHADMFYPTTFDEDDGGIVCGGTLLMTVSSVQLQNGAEPRMTTDESPVAGYIRASLSDPLSSPFMLF
jgi:hypothetical protein